MIVAKKCFQLLKPFFLLIIFLTSSNNNASNEKRVATSDVQIDVDQSEWADPLDPLKGYTSLQVGQGRPDNFHCDCSHQIAQMKTAISTTQRDDLSVDVLMKLVLRRFLYQLNIVTNGTPPSVDIVKIAQVTIKPEDYVAIMRYLNSEKVSEEVAQRENLKAALKDFIVELDMRHEGSLFTLLRSLMPYISVLNLIILPPCIYLIMRSITSFRAGFGLLFLTAFITSCYFTYTRKYQEILAQRFERHERARILQANGNSDTTPCSPKGLISEAFNVLLGYVTIKEKSECLRSFEDMLIEPIWLIDPLQIIGEVLSNFFFSPLTVAGKHLNTFFNDYLVHTPLPLALVKLGFIVLFVYIFFHFLIRELFLSLLFHRRPSQPPQQLQVKGSRDSRGGTLALHSSYSSPASLHQQQQQLHDDEYESAREDEPKLADIKSRTLERAKLIEKW